MLSAGHGELGNWKYGEEKVVLRLWRCSEIHIQPAVVPKGTRAEKGCFPNCCDGPEGRVLNGAVCANQKRDSFLESVLVAHI